MPQVQNSTLVIEIILKVQVKLPYALADLLICVQDNLKYTSQASR